MPRAADPPGARDRHERTTVDARTVSCVLTHDAGFDIPLLHLALTLPVGCVGVMGSRRIHDERMHYLDEAGLTESPPT
ncbi:XdhC family protein [Streptomyces sp. NPDC090994]|uniref:XdhC family protein n=1 Tax=Streptomyces sp. NPDC090994 TaxID=3365969 RepID=UPI00380731F2